MASQVRLWKSSSIAYLKVSPQLREFQGQMSPWVAHFLGWGIIQTSICTLKSWILPSSLLWVRPEGHRLLVLLHLPLFPVWFFSWIKILGLQEEVSSPGLMNSLLLTERKNRIRKHPSFPSFPAKSEGNVEHSIRGSLLLEFLPSVGNSLASVTSLMDLAKTKGLLPWLAYNHMPYVSFRGFQ